MYQGSNLSIEDSHLLRSTLYNEIEGVKSALKLKADINSSGLDLVTPLHIVAEKGYTKLAEFLVTVAGIDLNRLTAYGNTPLSLSIYHNNFKVTSILLKAGANPNALTIFDQTALHVATINGRLFSIKLLIEHEADVNVVDCFYRTPLYISLLSHPSDTITHVLLQAGADPNFRGKLKLSLLSLACISANSMKQVQAIATLIHFGAKVNERDLKNETPLHRTSRTGYAPLANLLVQHGADLNATNLSGKTPLDVAKFHRNQSASAVLEELEDEQLYAELSVLAGRSMFLWP